MLAENQLVFMLNRPFAKTTWFPDLQVLESSIEFDDLRPALDRYLGRATAAAAQALSSLTKLAPGRINDP